MVDLDNFCYNFHKDLFLNLNMSQQKFKSYILWNRVDCLHNKDESLVEVSTATSWTYQYEIFRNMDKEITSQYISQY